MARSCQTCSRSDAGEVNERLIGGRSARSVAAEFGLSHAALLRHSRNHLSRRLQPSQAPTPASTPVAAHSARPGSVRTTLLVPTPSDDLDPLDELVVALRVRALAGSPSDTREYRLSLQAQAAAKHAATSARDLADEPEWIALRTRLLRLLEPFPEARIAVAEGLA